MMFTLVTPWTPIPGVPQEQAELQDPAKDHLFRLLVADLLFRLVPAHILASLIDSGAQFVALPHNFFVMYPGEHPESWVRVPEISAYLNLLPWQELGEPCH